MNANRNVKPIATINFLVQYPEIIRFAGFTVDLFGDLS